MKDKKQLIKFRLPATTCLKFSLCLLVFLPITQLALGQSTNGDYIVERKAKTFSDKCLINGSVTEFNTNQPLKVATIYIDRTLITTDTLGRFQHELLPGRHSIRAGFIGYYRIDIENFKIRKGDSVNIKFRVKEDNTPLIN